MTTMLQSGQALAARYYLLRRIGTGRSGEVWLARDAQSRRDVAVKVLAPAAAADARARERFEHGAALQRELAGPRVIGCEGLHDDSGVVFAVLEAATRGDVSQLRGSDWQAVAPTLLEVAEGLAAVHARGYVHRDLKPANVLLTDHGAKLTDFELAARAGDRSAQKAGSPQSASPGQLAGEAPSTSDDIYSFGALAYELLSGYPPRHVQDDADVAALPSRAMVPAAVDSLIQACLSRDSRQRPASMAEVQTVLEAHRAEAGQATQAAARLSIQLTPPGGAVEPIVPTWKRSTSSGPSAEELRSQDFRRGLVVAALVLLVMAAGTVFFVLPDWVAQRKQRSPVAAQAPAPKATQQPQPTAEEKNLERLAGIKREFEELRPRVTERLAKLEQQSAGVWGGDEFATGKNRVAAAEAAFANRDYERALSDITVADRNLAAVEKLAVVKLPAALEAAEAALARGDAADATRQFQLALQIEPGNARATRGLKRAGVADQVRTLVAEGNRLEAEGRMQPALDSFRKASSLDPESRDAREGIARIDARVAGDAFATAITRGLDALGRRDYQAARSAFEAAGRIRPGAPEVRDGLAQIDRALGSEVITGHLARAQSAEREERWQEAVASYRKALEVDSNLLAAQQGLERSEPRAQLDAELSSYISRPERLFSADVRAAARAALERAKSLPRPAPTLDRQVARITELVSGAETPVRVALTSDAQTQVTIYRVGSLGSFERREMELMPGRYTVVGTRAGFRDVRREVTLLPGATPGPIVIRCEEPI